MKKLTAVLIFLFFIMPIVFCQDYVVDYNFGNGYTRVYKTSIISPNTPYQTAGPKSYGVIDAANKIVVPIKFKSVMFSGEPGVFIIKNELDNAGIFSAIAEKIIVEPEYFDIEIFREGLAVVK
ncbi:MAG TPA: WG repeat-containing protein, partial [Ferruginibacter sp.]|nr:WG repeat-containing protein [Ferruginibacter sp.]